MPSWSAGRSSPWLRLGRSLARRLNPAVPEGKAVATRSKDDLDIKVMAVLGTFLAIGIIKYGLEVADSVSNAKPNALVKGRLREPVLRAKSRGITILRLGMPEAQTSMTFLGKFYRRPEFDRMNRIKS